MIFFLLNSIKLTICLSYEIFFLFVNYLVIGVWCVFLLCYFLFGFVLISDLTSLGWINKSVK